MLVSYVLRLVPAEAAVGRIVGELESVHTGRTTTVHDVDELVTLISADQRSTSPVREVPHELSEEPS